MTTSQADGDPLIHELEALLDEGEVVEHSRRECGAPSPAALASLMPRYQVRALIGAGGMGQVFDAFDTQLQRRVAIKLVSRGGPLIADLMRRERKILAALEHPGIVGVFDCGELADGQPYYVMQFVEGEDLRTFALRAAGSLADKLRLVAEIARAVGVAHLLKVVHRDLKPTNIKVTAAGRPMVLDFGLAKYTVAHELDLGVEDEGHTFHTVASGRIKGTLAYMSPEQAAGERVDSRSDVYALGVILHELLTGRLPREPLNDGSTPLDWSLRLRSGPPPQLKLADGLPAAVRAIVSKCLAPQADDRYPTAIELADDLEAYLERRPVAAVRRGRSAHLAASFALRNRRPIAIAAAILAVLVATVTMAFIEVREQRNVAEANARRAQSEQRRAIDRENATRRYLYAADVGQAHRLWQNRQTDKAQSLLSRYLPAAGQPDLRTFEWRYVQQLAGQRPLALRGHEGEIAAVRYSPDARRVASADLVGGIRLWDAQSGELLRAVAANRSEIRELGFLPSPDRLYTIGSDRMLRLWDLERGVQLRSQWWLLRPLAAAASTPDGARIAVADTGGWVYLWDTNSGATLGQFLAHPERGVRSMVYSPDGAFLATGGKDRTARLWNARTHEPIATFQRHLGPIDALAFSPDVRSLATGSTDRILRVWQVADPSARPLEWQAGDEIVGVGFGADGGTIWAACKNGTVTFLSTDGSQRQTLHAETAGLRSADVSPDLQRIASTSGEATLRLLQASHLRESVRLATSESFTPARMSLDRTGRRLAVSYFHQPLVDVWDVQRQTRLVQLNGFAQNVTSVDFSPHDGRLLTTDMSGQALLWDVESATMERAVATSKVFRTAGTFAPHDAYFVVANASGLIEFFDLAGQPLPITLAGHDKMPIVDLRFSADGRWLASSGWDKTIHVWDLSDGTLRHVLRGHQGIVHTVRFSPDARQLASCGADGTVRLWDREPGSERVTLWRQPQEIFGLCYSRDGRTLAASSGNRSEDGSSQIRMWNLATLQETLSLEVGVGQIGCLEFAPADASLLAGAGPGREGPGILQFTAEQRRLSGQDDE